MKSLKWFVISLLWVSTSFAIEPEFLGYLRGGTGINLEGGKNNCFYNQGIPGNFMRLGNECEFYTELGITFPHKKPDEQDTSYFKTHFRLVAKSPGVRQWESATNSIAQQLEAYITVGGLNEIPGEIWIGKRFYRDADSHIMDWFYYADMSGVGAGIDNLSVGTGKLAVAHLIQGNDDPAVTTDNGTPVNQFLDIRYKSIPVMEDQNINFWAVYGFGQESTDGATEYADRSGIVLATRLNGPLYTGNNNFAVLYGTGLMRDFNIYGSPNLPVAQDYLNDAWTVRVVDDWVRDVTDKWAVMFTAAIEHSDSGADTDSIRQMQIIGIRPTYYVTDRFQMVFDAGFSRINDESEGDAFENRDLSRFTIAPQISFKKSVWGRPVMRFYVAHSTWSESNKTKVATGPAAAFADKTSGTNVGYQFETWF
ncbi:carbohydrate porin [Bdellovibrio bacteriovorus]